MSEKMVERLALAMMAYANTLKASSRDALWLLITRSGPGRETGSRLRNPTSFTSYPIAIGQEASRRAPVLVGEGFRWEGSGVSLKFALLSDLRREPPMPYLEYGKFPRRPDGSGEDQGIGRRPPALCRGGARPGQGGDNHQRRLRNHSR